MVDTLVNTLVTPLHIGTLLPESVLQSSLFAVLAAFVAINTVMYAALSVAKMLPKVYPGDWFGDRNRRTQTRSIYPEHLAAGDAAERSLERVG